MKFLYSVFIVLDVCLLLGASAFAQDAAVPKGEHPQGFDVLKQFEGTWETMSTSVATDKQPQSKSTGTMTSKLLGNNWIVNDYQGDVGGMKFKANQTLRFDKDNDKFDGTWVDSFMTMEWELSGAVNDNVLTINSQGPDYARPGKTTGYRDIYEFKSKTLIVTTSQMQNAAGEWKTFNNGTMTKMESAAKDKVLPFLMFIGKAEEAIEYYKTVFPALVVESMEKYGADQAEREGTVKLAHINIEGQRVKVIDSPPVHDFTFTPSFSFFVECDTEEQLKQRFATLSEGGKVMMPVNNYGFSKQFGWVSDKFGVSWQLNLE